MSCLKESIAEAMKTLPAIYAYTGPDEVVHPEDPNLKDVNHLAVVIRKVCNLNFDDLPSDRDLSKEQVLEIVELVERELLSHPSVKPVRRDKLVSHLLAIRVKDENQLIEEFDKIGMEVIKNINRLGLRSRLS